MSKQTDHDPEFTALQTQINKVYHQQTLEQPSADLDIAILAKARSGAHVSVGEKTNKSLWQRNAWLFSSAASVLLVVGLFMITPSWQQLIGVDAEQAIPTQPALPKQAIPQQIGSVSVVAATEKAIVIEGLSMKVKSASTIKNDPSSNDSVNSKPVAEESTTNAPSEQPALMRAEPAQVASDTAKQAVVANSKDVATQKKAIELPSHRNDKEIQLLKQQSENSAKGIIQLDTADVALARLKALMADNKTIQAERYMITMDQRFPELSNKAHPLYEQYQKIKVQLTSK